MDLGGDVCVADVFVYEGDEPTTVPISPVLSDCGVVFKGGCFLSACEFSLLYVCYVDVIVV